MRKKALLIRDSEICTFCISGRFNEIGIIRNYETCMCDPFCFVFRDPRFVYSVINYEEIINVM